MEAVSCQCIEFSLRSSEDDDVVAVDIGGSDLSRSEVFAFGYVVPSIGEGGRVFPHIFFGDVILALFDEEVGCTKLEVVYKICY